MSDSHRRALISVSDKSGLKELATLLSGHGYELVSTGGTARTLEEAGFDVKDVSELTRFPEMMDGRVKTLHPAVHGGLLALRDNPNHVKAMEAHGIGGIDILVVNLYPFEATLAGGADFDTCIENVDIGGPAMIRAGAKNHAHVTVIVDGDDYELLAEELRTGGPSHEFRKRMAAKAYARTAAYDSAIANWYAREMGVQAPKWATLAGELRQELRYGENPHQHASFYVTSGPPSGISAATQHQGKALSYNNINDADAALELCAEFPPEEGAACVIVKHANPCGMARASSLREAYNRAFQCDQTSAFGGIVALNQPLDEKTAQAIVEIFTEVVIAPQVSEAARTVLATRKNVRLLTTGAVSSPGQGVMIKDVRGGFLRQSLNTHTLDLAALRCVTKRQPSEAEFADMLLAWKVAKHVKSNAIVYARDGATVGIGAGQMSRVDSTRIAERKARDMAELLSLPAPLTRGSVVASDAFFPFTDGLLTAAKAGATAVIQPGGSVRDEEIIAAADDAGLAMLFTGMRHFRH